MKIQFCGATTGVTGSCHLIKTEKHNVLLDCGQFQGGKAQEAMNSEPFPFDPKSIEYVVLSHAHIDHCGRIPLLVKRGFTGRIYCTSATADLLRVMLEDSAYIHERDAEWQNKKNQRSGLPEVQPLYTLEDASRALTLVRPVQYDQMIELNEDIRFVFNDAGHILGSAITELWVKEDGGETKIVFSGDLGVMNRPILRDPTIIKKADCVIMESTYGDRLHPDNAMDVRRLIDIIIKTTDRGGCVVIPSFAVGRTQEILYELNRFYDEHTEFDDKLDKVNVFIDSPMATTATEVFRRNAQVFDDEAKEYIVKGDDPLDFKNLHFTRSTEQSRSLNLDKSPKVIISASGMCEAGRIRHHLRHHLWDPKSSIVFVGYQAAGTLGRALIDGKKDISLFGDMIHVEAEIYNLEGFSGHADQKGLLDWISGFQKKPSQVFLVHGEEEGKLAFAKLIKEKLGYDPVAVMGNSEYELKQGESELELLNEEEAGSEAACDEDVQKVRNQISEIHSELENIIFNAQIALNKEISEEKLQKINNIVQDLNKSSMDLASAVLEKKGQ
ncbi:MAG: MBL fold metallo-hydrolase [Eubacterium sp.]|nr:MBL fold metallo-hydrolase [Eubacterium sp.]